MRVNPTLPGWRPGSDKPAMYPTFALISIQAPSGTWVMLDAIFRYSLISGQWHCTRSNRPLHASAFRWLDTCSLLAPLNQIAAA